MLGWVGIRPARMVPHGDGVRGECREDDLILPDERLSEDANAKSDIVDELNSNLLAGLPASFHQAVSNTIRDLASFVDMVEKAGVWVSSKKLSEKQLQEKLHQHLHSLRTPVLKGAELGGGETDLILHELIVIENKACKETADPFGVLPNAAWQGRRYSIPLCSRVGFVVVGYRPSNEAALLSLPRPDSCSPNVRCTGRTV